jgi:hypothetical protein
MTPPTNHPKTTPHDESADRTTDENNGKLTTENAD